MSNTTTMKSSAAVIALATCLFSLSLAQNVRTRCFLSRFRHQFCPPAALRFLLSLRGNRSRLIKDLDLPLRQREWSLHVY